ncbi:hypothetical protein H4S01_004612 [Coemansia sp. RSA 2610]|nr:hypothetical protein H4S01_004612 [Coemansia sp. RSA 2610]
MLAEAAEGRAVDALDDARDRQSALDILRSRHRRSSIGARRAAAEANGDGASDASVRRSLRSAGGAVRLGRGRGRGRQASRSSSDEEEEAVEPVSSDDDFQPRSNSTSTAALPRARGGRRSQQQQQQRRQQARTREVQRGRRRQRRIASDSDDEPDSVTGGMAQVDIASDVDVGGESESDAGIASLASDAGRGGRTIDFTSDEDEGSPPERAEASGDEPPAAPAPAIDPLYVPTDWILATRPSTVPYRPQVGDEVVYFREGHADFWNSPARCKRLSAKLLPYEAAPGLAVAVFGKVAGLQYSVGPPAFCTVKIQLLQQQTVEELDAAAAPEPTRRVIQVQYHDCDGVPDFLVLYSRYRASLRRPLRAGDRVEVLFDEDQAHAAEVTGFRDNRPTSRQANAWQRVVRSPWRSIEVLWTQADGAQRELVSPWELVHDAGADPQELRPAQARRLAQVVDGLRSNPEFAWFVGNVDYVHAYPNYLLNIAYPMCLDTVRARLASGFYRHAGAVLFDVELIRENADIFNDPGTVVPIAAQELVAQYRAQAEARLGGDEKPTRKRKPAASAARRSARRRVDASSGSSSDGAFSEPESDPESDDLYS